MRISHDYRFVLLSNSQSGSSSIRKMLDPWSDIKSSHEFPWHHHINASLLRKQFQQRDWDWNRYFRFTTVRNPWDRMVGRYHYGLKNPNSCWHQPAVGAGSFSEFLENPFIAKAAPKTTLEHFVFGQDGTCLVDEILKLESLRETLPPIMKKLGLRSPGLQHVNRSSHRHYSDYYDDASRERVREWFRFDIEFGSYQFEQPRDQADIGSSLLRRLFRRVAAA